MVMVDGQAWQQTGTRTPAQVCDAACQLHLAHIQGATDRFDTAAFADVARLADMWSAAVAAGDGAAAQAAFDQLVAWVDSNGWAGSGIDPRILAPDG